MKFEPKDEQEKLDWRELLATQRAEREAAARRLREAARVLSERITALELAK